MNPTLAGLALATLLAQLGTSIANVALPTLALGFGVDPGAASGIIATYLAAVTVVSALIGPLGDRWGRRNVLFLGLALFATASLAASLTPSLTWLLAARALQGMGAAALLVFSLALVGEVVPAEKVGRAMGLLATSNAVGTALGPSLGGVLLASFGWPAVFAVLVPLAVLAAVLLRKLPARPRTVRRSLGLPRESRRSLVTGLVQNGLAMAVLMATLVVGPFFLSGVFGLGPVALGLVMTVGPAVAALLGVPAGLLVDRWGARRLISVGLVGMAAGSLLLALLPSVWGIVGYAVSLATLTASYAVFQTANNTALVDEAPPEHRGAVSGLLSLSRNLGLLAGTVGLGGLFAALGNPLTTALGVTFGVGSALLALALLIGARR